MSDTSQDARDPFEELRDLLTGEERAGLAALRKRLDDPQARAVETRAILPLALRLGPDPDPKLSLALQQPLTEALKTAIRRDPQSLADALFPVLGPAIRRAIAIALRGMVESLNQLIQHSVSGRSWRWRLDAWRTGRSFAEMVLLHSLIYRVELVVLIHRKTGLPLHHVAMESLANQDTGVVSGMLSALMAGLQDFMKDSFSLPEGDALRKAQMGDLDVWITPGPHAFIAAVVRGSAPQELQEVLEEAVEAIHQEQAADLEAFSGDTAPMARTEPHLRSCLQAKYDESEPHRPGRRLWLLPVLFLGACVAVLGFLSLRESLRWGRYLDMLSQKPGIVVTATAHHGSRHFIFGLRDPLGVDPTALLLGAGLDPGKVVSRWEPFESLEPDFVARRARSVLQPPSTVQLNLDPDGTLHITGTASHRWLADAQQVARVLPGLARLDLGGVTDTDRDRARRSREAIEAIQILFQLGTALFLPGQKGRLDELAERMHDLRRATHNLGEDEDEVRVVLTGHADALGTEPLNMALSKDRAAAVLQHLLNKGLPGGMFERTGVGSTQPLRPGQRAEDRSVSFRVITTPYR